jgi:hypothetical protein
VSDVRRRDDRVFVITRLTAAVVIIILCFGVVSLLVFPTRTDDLWSWEIRAQMTSMLLGSGYAAGAYFFLRVLFARRWHTVQIGFLPIAGFTVLMEIATILHWDVFFHGRFAFQFWFVIYSTMPFVVPLVWYLNQRTATAELAESDALLPRVARAIIASWGGGMILMSAFLFLLPDQAARIWPWPLTPLTSRVLGAWFIWGMFALLLARDGRWSSGRAVTQATIVGTVLALVGVVRAWGEFDTGRPFTYVFLTFLGLALVFFIVLHVVMDRLAQGAPAAPATAPAHTQG